MIEVAGEYGRQWAGYFGPLVIQNTVFLTIVFLVLYLVRHASARVKFAVGTIGIIKLLLPPFVPSALVAASPSALSPVPQLASNLVFISSAASSYPKGTTAGGMDVTGVLFVAWAAVAASYALLALLATCRLTVRLRNAAEVPAEQLPGDLDLGTVKVLRTDRISLPITVGVLPRRIYVPDSWEHWSDGCRRIALKHEMAHIRRHDGVFQVAEITARALYFFHPLVWLLTHRLEQFREMACDDASTGAGQDSRLEYSRNLVEIAETVARDTLTCQSASALLRRKNELINRVKYQMKEGVMRNFSKKSTLALLAAVAVFIVPLSWYQTDAAPDKKAVPGVKSPADMQVIDVSITGADAIRVDGAPVTLATLGNALDNKATGDPAGYVINIDCANDVPMRVVFDVQRDLQSRDLVKVSYASDLPDAMPLVLPSKALEERIKSIPEENMAVVQVDASGRILLDGRKTPADKLSERIEELIKKNDKVIVGIRMEDATTYRDFVKVLDAVKRGNAQRVLIHNPPK